MSRSRMRAASAVVLLMVAGGITFVVGGALGIGGGLAIGGPQGHPLATGSTPAPDQGSPVTTGVGRTGAFCVDALSVSSVIGDEETLEDTTRANAITVATDGLASAAWEPLNWSEVTVTAGCPAPPLPLTMEGAWTFGTPNTVPPSVDALSPYSLFVYVMPLENIENLLGGTDVRVAAQEYQCRLDVCFWMRTALYVSPDEAADPEILRARIEEGLGLRASY